MLHEGEFAIDDELVGRLIATQFSEWSDLPLRRVTSSGTVNVIYRLGDDMAVRLPRLGEFSPSIAREIEWLPKLAPALPLRVPEPVAAGDPTDDYPSPWSIVNWIDGENATPDCLTDLSQAAARLGAFVVALRRMDTAGAPTGNYRGGPLATRDAATRKAIEQVGNEFNTYELTAAWDSALAAPVWSGDPLWFHGDLHSGNLLATEGDLSAVLDFGGVSVGDPSCDLIAGWWLFDEESRSVLKETTQADSASWNRGRGWALSVGLVALPYYFESNPVFAEMSRRAIRQVLSDQ